MSHPRINHLNFGDLLKQKDFNILSFFVVVFVFNVPPTAKVIWRGATA